MFDTARLWLSLRLMTAWELYRYGVGLVAYVFDWTLSMTWLNAIITPLDAAARQIRDQVISPIGLASVMLLISAVVGSIRIVYGKTGRGIWDILSAAAVAAAVAVLLVSPVAAVTGEPLTKVRNAGLGIAAMIDGKNLGRHRHQRHPRRRPAEAGAGAGRRVRPPRPRPDQLRRQLHRRPEMHPRLRRRAQGRPVTSTWAPTTSARRSPAATRRWGSTPRSSRSTPPPPGSACSCSPALLVGATVLTGCVLLFISVMMLGWSLLKLVITGVIGIGPGDTRGPLIRNALTALASLLYVGTSTIVLALVLVLIKNAFATDVGNPMARFLLVDVILIGGLVIVIQTWAAHRRGAQSWTDKAMAKFKQTHPEADHRLPRRRLAQGPRRR